MSEERMIMVRGQLVRAPLCDNCHGSGLIPERGNPGISIVCPACKGRGEHRERETALPQITDEYQAH